MLLVGSASFYIQLSELVWWWWHLWDRVPKWWQNTWWQRWRWQLSVFQSFSCKTWFWLRRPTVFSFLTSNPSSNHLSCPESSSESETEIFFCFFTHPTLRAFLSYSCQQSASSLCCIAHAWVHFLYIELLGMCGFHLALLRIALHLSIDVILCCKLYHEWHQ